MNVARPLEGGCGCGEVRYRIAVAPLFVHCCHCTWCQRETGGAFALNAIIETAAIEHMGGAAQAVHTPSASGAGQAIHRCPACAMALWSHYFPPGPALAFVRVGTLDEGHGVGPDIHIFTSTRQPWLSLAEGIPVVSEYYDPSTYWPPEALARRSRALKV